MAITHVFDRPPPGVADDWTMPQNRDQFSNEEHDRWDFLVSRQASAFADYASQSFLDGLDVLRLSKPGIPDFDELNPLLDTATGWRLVAVPGVIPNHAFFSHLAERRFPIANFLRGADSLDYSDEPDMFHDLFGHVPMLTDPAFAEFLVSYGRAGLRAEKLGATDFLARLYLYTVEFGLVVEKGQLRGYGAGLLSSLSETVHALTSPDARRVHIDLPRVMQTEYLFDEFQKIYFVVESFEQLLRLTEETDFAKVYARLQDEPPLAPDAVHPGDRLCDAIQ
ncbi:MAG: phenylalanine 4-monooxygenase [Blastomonas sp.]